MAEQMDQVKRHTARAPYNFVPLSPKKPYLRYESVDQLPPHNVIDPKLKTGEIHVTLKAETPVYIGGSDQDNPDFFRDGNGRYAIPGSSLRGMVRENMTILGFGLMRPGENFEDRRILYREMSAAEDSLRADLKKTYAAALKTENIRVESRTGGRPSWYSVPKNVRAGYLRRIDGQYFIQPVQGKYLKVTRGFLRENGIQDRPACTMQVAYTARGDRVTVIRQTDTPIYGMKLGTLLFTGNPIGNRPNRQYVFPLPDEDADPVEISGEDSLSYAADWEDRVNNLKAYYNVNFWKLPDEGEEKPVFYLEYDGHVYFGMSLFLRVGYQYALSQGLPDPHREILEKDPCALDYVYAMLGFAQKEHSYRSRVAFENCVLTGTACTSPRFKAILGGPKPSFFPAYVKDGMHYGKEKFQLRGSKQYWLKSPEHPEVDPKRDSVAAVLCPLAEGSEFRGVIRYRNLTEDELGLLLWALRLDKGCYQSLGMGKPLGLGRMTLTIDALKEFRPDRMYSLEGLCAGVRPASNTEDAVEQYIRIYDNYICEKLYVKKPKKRPSLRSLTEIKDFFFIRSTIMDNDEVSYMALEEYGNNVKYALPEVERFRAEAEEKQRVQAAEPEETLSLEEQIRRFNARRL